MVCIHRMMKKFLLSMLNRRHENATRRATATPADFNFHIGRIPVRVTGWFWPAAGLFGWGLAQSLAGDDTRTLLIYLGVWVLLFFAPFSYMNLGMLCICGIRPVVTHCVVSLRWLGGTQLEYQLRPLESFTSADRFCSGASCATRSCYCCHSYSDGLGIKCRTQVFEITTNIGNSLEEVSLSAQPIPSILGWLMVYHLLFVNMRGQFLIYCLFNHSMVVRLS